MLILISGLLLFVLIHLLPTRPSLRTSLIEKIGANPYKVLFSIISLAAIFLIVWGLKTQDAGILYTPFSGARHITFPLVLIALYLILSNPLGPAPSSAKYFTAHPMSWGFVAWSVGHLLSNGHTAHVLLFGTFLIYSIVAIISGTARGQKPALTKRPPLIKELVFIIVVIAIYVVLLKTHQHFTGMPLI